jgi:hypothetical protein
MRLARLKSFLLWAFAVMVAAAVAGCDNPFDPLSTTDRIQGLTYFDFAATQEHWDSDPEWDGLQIVMNYYNEFGTVLSFHDKPHYVQVEIWSETTNTATPPVVVRGTLLASKTVIFSNSDDFIRIPIEYYASALDPEATEDIQGYLLIRVYPPEEYPQKELVFAIAGVDLFKVEPAPVTITE